MKKLLSVSIIVILILVFSGCKSNNNQDNSNSNSNSNEVSDRVIDIQIDEDNFPSGSVDDGKDVVLTYKITNAKFVDSIEVPGKEELIPEGGKYLIVEFSAINQSTKSQYGTVPRFTLKYQGETFMPNNKAGEAEATNAGLENYKDTPIESGKKGKYVRVFDINNYTESDKTFVFVIDASLGKAIAEISVNTDTLASQ